MKELNCFAETDDGLARLTVREGNGEEEGEIRVWENDDFRDDMYMFSDLFLEYGEFYYETKQDFKADNKKKFVDYFD